ncbi:hypothetical protein Asi02nite_59230 [Asanoa siamensis]|uniref:Ketoreductase domain-containing protein n=1 Tax=Asanoa siamensis TaxID=926357 RepID=A0ABQ4CYQ4_9ACTN|nr:hypothetical protein Asi02nite_59230 [Asanoa siamensis]
MSRVVVVSGGGTGIGRAVAASCVKDGDAVVIIGRRPEVLASTAAEIDAHAIVADVGEVAEAERAATEVAKRFGHVDVLVNNAGGNALLALTDPAPATSPVARASAAWLANLRSNVLTAVHLTEALRDVLADNARVVLLSSIAAFRGSGSGSYGGSKAALHPYAIDLAAALGPRGITVNVVAPGYTTDTEFFGATMTDQRHDLLVGQALNKRAGHTDDVAATIRWLTSPDAGHVTAQIIQVNGGALPGVDEAAGQGPWPGPRGGGSGFVTGPWWRVGVRDRPLVAAGQGPTTTTARTATTAPARRPTHRAAAGQGPTTTTARTATTAPARRPTLGAAAGPGSTTAPGCGRLELPECRRSRC